MIKQTTAAIILAAGKSGRMGKLKPLLPLEKRSVLDWAVTLFLTAGISDVRVVVGYCGEDIRHRLAALPVTWIHNKDYHQGMLSSIKKGIGDLALERTGFFLLPADIPLVRPRTIAAMLKQWSTSGDEASILYPTFLEKRGHPPLISTRLIPEILSWKGPGGLDKLLESHELGARNLPVIDEYILRDMDTRSDYEKITTARNHYNIPTIAECKALLANPSFFTEATAAHCLAVSELANFFGSKIASKNNGLNLSLLSAAAMLHDVAKGRPNHAHEGAALLSELGFSGIAEIVAAHMDIDFPEDTPLTERELVYLADKLFKGDSLVPISHRFDAKLARFGQDPDVQKAILKRKNNALNIVRCLEKESGEKLQVLLDEYRRSAS